MALCPHCQHVLPDPPDGLCPNCGGDPRVPGSPEASPAVPGGGPPPLPPGFGAAPEAPPPTPSLWPPHAPGSAPAAIPWDQRDRIGFFNALVETTRQVLSEPGAFFRAMPVSGGLGSPLLYAVIVGWIGLAAAAFYQAIFRSVVGSSWEAFGDRPELAAVLGWLEGWAGFLAQVVFGGIFIVLGVFIAAGILHLMLMLLGGARRDFEATFRVVCYSEAFSILAVIPFCGTLVVIPYVLVLYVVGLTAVHGVGEGHSYAAVVLAVIVPCCCALGLLVVLGGLAGLAGLSGLVTP